MTVGLVWLFASCKKEETLFDGPSHIRFTDTSASSKESNKELIRIPIHLVGPTMSEPVKVNYTITGTAREGIDYRIEGEKGTVTIPANSYSGSIDLRLINNANNTLESQELNFTLTGVSSDKLQVGWGANKTLGKTFTYTILDECIFSGTYSGQASGLGVNPNKVVKGIILSSSDCREYTVSNWNIGFPDVAVNAYRLFNYNAIKPDLVFVDNGDNSIEIQKQVETYLPSEINLIKGFDTIQGQGFFNPLNKQIILQIQVKILDPMKDSTAIYSLTLIPE
jgi:hypothetical protein